jgi:acetyl-CoA synthetase
VKEPTTFSWAAVRRELSGPSDGGLNIGDVAVDRHVRAGDGDRVALRFLAEDGTVRDVTFQELQQASGRFANALATLGVSPGERVFTLLGRVPELYVVAIGALKRGCVFSSLFSSFGPEPVRTRLGLGGAKVLVTTRRLYEQKVAPHRSALPALRHVLIVDDDSGAGSLPELVDSMGPDCEITGTQAEDVALLHFTSGTTGLPKGALHVHEAVLAHYATARTALDLRPDDVFWCTADPGWVTGVSYGIIAPLAVGCTTIVDERDFDAARWYDVLEAQAVSVCYTAPTAIRMLMRFGEDLAASYDLSRLRLVASVGEPLSAAAVRWGERVLGLPVRDTWWQTETGSIMIASQPEDAVKAGAIGRPLPGVDARVVHRLDGQDVVVVGQPDETGELVLRRDWPSMFRGYLGDPDRYRECFSGEWYLTGDLVRRDADGYFRFVGRLDDVIKSAGHLVGPVEVEHALAEHDAVAEVAVVGRPDPVAGEVVKAFVTLAAEYEPSAEMAKAILAHGRARLGAALAPKEVEFVQTLPKTHSGKIMRRALRDGAVEREERG